MPSEADRSQLPPPVRIRPLAAADISEVAHIESLSSPMPWTADIFRGCLRPDYVCLALESGGRIAGFAFANEAAGEGHLLNIAVHPNHRARGLGAMLLGTVLANLVRRSVEVVFLEVRHSNTRAISLYHRHGFREIGVRRNYYALGSGREDALTMRLELER